MEKSLQERYAPTNRCFGCGPANEKGLRIRSFPSGEDGLVCRWTPDEHHQAFAGILNGGIVGALLDCHGNWTATWHLMRRLGLETPPCSVTAEYAIRLLAPTPLDRELVLHSKVASSTDRKVVVEATLEADGTATASFRGTFVAVKEGHPAYRRW